MLKSFPTSTAWNYLKSKTRFACWWHAAIKIHPYCMGTADYAGTADYSRIGEYAQLDLRSILLRDYFGHLSIFSGSFMGLLYWGSTNVCQAPDNFWTRVGTKNFPSYIEAVQKFVRYHTIFDWEWGQKTSLAILLYEGSTQVCQVPDYFWSRVGTKKNPCYIARYIALCYTLKSADW